MKSLTRLMPALFALLAAGTSFAADMHQELDDIARRLATKIEATERKNVAVADFTDLEGQVRQLGRFVSEEVSTNLVLASQKFSVIDRNHLRTILKEQKLSLSGLMDPENQKKLGKILGVDALILGSITPYGESYRVTFKVVATDTAQMVGADRGAIPKTPATDELWNTIMVDDIATETTSTTTTTSTPRAGGVPVIVSQTKRGEYGGQYLTFSIESIGLSKDKKSATLVGRLTNVSKHDVYVAAHSYNEKDKVPGISMVDDAGGLWVRAAEVVGLPTYPYSAADMMRYREQTSYASGAERNINSYYGLLTPGQSQPVNVAFKPVGNVGDPKIFSFSANLYMKVPLMKTQGSENKQATGEEQATDDKAQPQWNYTQTAIGISGIKAQ